MQGCENAQCGEEVGQKVREEADEQPAKDGTNEISFEYSTEILLSPGALRAPPSSWKPFRPLDFVLRALQALRPCVGSS